MHEMHNKSSVRMQFIMNIQLYTVNHTSRFDLFTV